MFSRWLRSLRSTAAWRICLWTTVAFAAGSAVAFMLIYSIVAKGIWERSDAWLRGEVEVLADVSSNTLHNEVYDELVGEIVRHAATEVSEGDTKREPSVFFLLTRPGQPPLWVGPNPREAFQQEMERSQFQPEAPQSLTIPGRPLPFRVISRSVSGGRLYLGYADLTAATFLERLSSWFFRVWVGMVVLGFGIAFTGAYRTLRRVEMITHAVGSMGSEALGRRLPEGRHDDEISRLAHTFNLMLGRIQASVQELRILTDSVAHDLKSPVTSIRGSLETALSETGDNWRDLVAEAVDKLDDLAATLNTALDLAEAEAGALPVHREAADLAQVLQQFVELYQPVMAEHGHELICSLGGPVPLDADMSLLNRILANLLDNEIAHLPSGCRIELAVRQREGETELTLEDNGPGLPPEVRARLFQRFVKGRRSSGHGLGLAFVNAAVQAHGGRVRIADRPGGGVIIGLTLPRNRTLAAEGAA